jgi:tRNA G18 (ribose-2'-O)-methylase SpoU
MFVRIRNEGIYVVGIEIADEAIPLSKLPSVIRGKERVCFVFGNEAHGMSKKALSYCDTVIYIPQYGKKPA